MKLFLQDTRGNASLWAAFAMAVLFVLAVAVYTGATLYSTYQTAQTELERAANVSVDASLLNENVRDLVLDIPADSAEQKVSSNLTSQGFAQEADGDWARIQDGKTRYHLDDVQITVSGKELDITATLVMPLPWAGHLHPLSLAGRYLPNRKQVFQVLPFRRYQLRCGLPGGQGGDVPVLL